MKQIGYEMYCRDCQHEWREDRDNENCYECPQCQSHDVYKNRFITCSCGTTVYLDNSLTNDCEGCGKLYNGSGQELAPPEEWDEEDRYDCFGPQNYNEDY